MNNIGFIVIVTTILHALMDWIKTAWAGQKQAKCISMAVSTLGAAALVITFQLDLLVALGLTTDITHIGGVFAAVAIAAGSELIRELIQKVSGTKAK